MGADHSHLKSTFNIYETQSDTSFKKSTACYMLYLLYIGLSQESHCADFTI